MQRNLQRTHPNPQSAILPPQLSCRAPVSTQRSYQEAPVSAKLRNVAVFVRRTAPSISVAGPTQDSFVRNHHMHNLWNAWRTQKDKKALSPNVKLMISWVYRSRCPLVWSPHVGSCPPPGLSFITAAVIMAAAAASVIDMCWWVKSRCEVSWATQFSSMHREVFGTFTVKMQNNWRQGGLSRDGHTASQAK